MKFKVGDRLSWLGKNQTYIITETKPECYKLKHLSSNYHEWNTQAYVESSNVKVKPLSKLERALK